MVVEFDGGLMPCEIIAGIIRGRGEIAEYRRGRPIAW
jgi:hypothetical protein